MSLSKQNAKVPTSTMRPSSKISSVGKQNDTLLCYTIIGWHDYLDDDERPVLCDTDKELAEDRDVCFAMNKRGRYHIKKNNSGQMYNPFDDVHGGTHGKESNRLGKTWTFREVSKVAFERYVYFLKTKNRSYLLNAEREI